MFSLVEFAGRSGLGPEGRRFESFHPDYQKPLYSLEYRGFFVFTAINFGRSKRCRFRPKKTAVLGEPRTTDVLVCLPRSLNAHIREASLLDAFMTELAYNSNGTFLLCAFATLRVQKDSHAKAQRRKD